MDARVAVLFSTTQGRQLLGRILAADTVPENEMLDFLMEKVSDPFEDGFGLFEIVNLPIVSIEDTPDMRSIFLLTDVQHYRDIEYRHRSKRSQLSRCTDRSRKKR